MKNKIGRMTTCSECGYGAITWGFLKCTKCGGKLKVFAQEKKMTEHKTFKDCKDLEEAKEEAIKCIRGYWDMKECEPFMKFFNLTKESFEERDGKLKLKVRRKRK